ncbi:MAG: DUF932 domain-containing protein [Candidatus Marinimicrobia bacterium]|nr:DUF932 domain-containing protein [Candidatus Neomarinimicrobiota bacterium]
MTLLLHQGGQECSLQDLRDIPMPAETHSFKPVSHYDLAVNIVKVAGELLSEFSLRSSQYGVARDGGQLFGVHTFQNSNSELGLSIAFRNSMDKSLSVGMAFGASVFVCDNLALLGEIVKIRKHTTFVHHDLEEMILTGVYRARTSFISAVDDARLMQQIEISTDGAYRALGHLFGHKVLSPRQMPVALKEWNLPSHEEFEPRTLWSLYNAVTEALKSSPPQSILERHIQLHAHLLPNQERWSA